MPFATTHDGVRLHYEETGSGSAVIFVHEFAGDHRSWEPQMRHFGRRHRCIAYNARGYPPSDVPEEVGARRARALPGRRRTHRGGAALVRHGALRGEIRLRPDAGAVRDKD